MQEYDHIPLQQGDEAGDWGINSESNVEQCQGRLCHKGFTVNAIDLLNLGWFVFPLQTM